jgi:Lon protease-like protein
MDETAETAETAEIEPSLPPLPMVAPVFPLPEPLLLPGTVVPLEAGEPRYRELLEDALARDGYVAVLQPVEWLAPGEDAEEPELFSVGCLGRIGECEEEEPGKLVALVEGVIRFRVLGEVPGETPYRRVRVDYVEFLEDRAALAGELEFASLKDVVRHRIESTGSEIDLSIMEGMVGTELVTALAHAMPFSPAERQVLMETPSLRELEGVLLNLMATGPDGTLGFDLPPLLPS